MSAEIVSTVGEPIAIVGQSCRFPGAPSPGDYWQLLADGRSAVSSMPRSRARAMGVHQASALGAAGLGGFIDDVDRFDPVVFGISPREAAAMDPQQRLMLELSWEALEEASIVPAAIRGRVAGVFIGAMSGDYASLAAAADAGDADHHAFTGLTRSLIANRISYVFGLRGPSLVIDAGQASSLVAVHAAARSLSSGESDLALAGGVELHLAADSALVAERFGGLSPDGQCYTFDARANGYVRGEGGAVVVLKTLARAVTDGDRIHAVILGGAVNNDGGGPGLTVPHEAAQRELLRLACHRAGVDPGRVQYVELHGTGTKAGDPVEASALGAVLGAARPAGAALPVGSAKTNVGHLGAAAGMAGLLKVALAIEHGQLPASLNFTTPNPAIPLADLNLRVQDSLGQWPEPDATALAGVSSFSVGGTNCHLVLAPPPATRQPRSRRPRKAALAGPVPLAVSGSTAAAMRAQARRLGSHAAAHPEVSVSDLGYSLATSRSALAHRSIVLANSREDMLAELAALASGERTSAQVSGVARSRNQPVFVFPGQGSQWPGMAAGLLASSDVFADRIRACAAALGTLVDWSVEDVLRGTPGAPPLDRVDVVQPVLFAVMVGLAGLWRSFGVEPVAVVGQSQGEVAAACVAGGLSLADAATVVAARSLLLRSMAGQGAMASIELSAAELASRPASQGGLTGIAVISGPRSVVVTGGTKAVSDLVDACKADGVRAHLLPVDYASHSPAVEAIREPLLRALSGIVPRTSAIPFYSSVTGQRLDTSALDASYWYRNLREPVDFDAVIRSLADHDAFIEISPHPVLTTAVEQILQDAGSAAIVTESLRKNENEPRRFLTSVARFQVNGGDVDWRPALPGDARLVALPTYPFQRRRYWLDAAGQAAGHDQGGPSDEATDLRGRVLGLGPGAAALVVLDEVRSQAAKVLRHEDHSAIDPACSFADLGFDSVTALELRQRLTEITGLPLRTTVLYDCPSPAKLASQIGAELAGSDGGDAPAARTNTVTSAPAAIISMACRFPGGVSSPRELWQLAVDGKNATSGFPVNRGWDLDALHDPAGRPGTSAVTSGGFLHDADQFDAAFFGISPREAIAMDPQQRLLLELTWEAIERAGIEPTSLRGSRCGVFVGAMAQEYGPRLHEAPAGSGGYLLTGTSASVLSGRLAYAFGLQGPAVTIDTACSSSLVALHLAISALRQGECSLAVVGGVTIMSSPGIFTEFSRQHGLAADGRCKPFTADADGTAWSEGIGVVVLEPLSLARRHGHRVHALVRGSAVNSDGASNGLTAPSGPAQERVIRAALASAGLDTADVDAVEAHGTGTKLGDPIEAHALLATYGQDRQPARPLLLGSVKSHIGHTQAAAGIAGLIVMAESLKRELLPPLRPAGPPSPYVDWAAGAVSLLAQARPWPEADRVRRAGISSFGISGTNAHVIIEQAPAAPAAGVSPPSRPDPAAAEPVPWPVTARDSGALRAQAQRLAAHATTAVSNPHDLGFSLATTRTTFGCRAVTLAPDIGGHVAALTAIAAGQPCPGAVTGAAARSGPLAFMFTGQGSQRPAMGLELYDRYPVFADALDEVCAEFEPELDWPLRDRMFAPAGTAQSEALQATGSAQPALFALQVALHRLVSSFGLRADYLIGHSIGELTAAHIAGVLSLADAAALVASRGRLMQELPRTGAMVALSGAESEVLPLLDDSGGQVSIAAVNGPSAVVISGSAALVDGIAERWLASGRKAKRLRVSHAFHSAQMDPMLAEFRQVAAAISYQRPRIPVVGNISGRLATASEMTTADYWTRHVREAVRFGDGIGELAGLGVTGYLELGPDAVLTGLTQGALAAARSDPGREPAPVVAAALRAGRGEIQTFLTALARLYAHGTDVDWQGAFDGQDVRQVELPTYPFQRRRYWLAPTALTNAVTWPATAATGSEATDAIRPNGAAGTTTPNGTAGTNGTTGASGTTGPDSAVQNGRAGRSGLADRAACWHDVRWIRIPVPARTPGRLTFVGAKAASLAELLPAGLLPGHQRAGHYPDLTVLAASVAGTKQPPENVLVIIGAPADAGPDDGLRQLPDSVRQLTGDALGVIQQWLAASWTAKARLIIVTHGAVAALPDDDLGGMASASVWGLVRGAQAEHPGRVSVFDLDGQAASVAAIPAAIATAEPQLAIRGGELLAPRILPGTPAPDAPQSADGVSTPGPELTPGTALARGTVLITGGLGALGALAARQLVSRHGVRQLLLAGRSGHAAPGAAAVISELTELGASVRVAACDVADYDQLAALLDSIPAEHPLTAVVHAAGVLRDGQLASLTAEQLSDVLRPKVDAAWNLHLLSRDLDLAAFLIYSSAVGLVGNPGQSGYAAANTFLDALAQYRRRAGLVATSLAWGHWVGAGGMAAGLSRSSLARLAGSGIAPMQAGEALALLDDAFGATAPLLVPARFDVAAMRSDPGTSILSGLAQDRAEPADSAAASQTAAIQPTAIQEAAIQPTTAQATAQSAAGVADAESIADHLAGQPEAEQRRRLLGLICAQAAQVLGHASPDAIRPDQGFLDAEFDSLSLEELRVGLEAATGLRFSDSVVFDHPTPAALAEHLRVALARPATGPPASQRPRAGSGELDRLEAALPALRADEATRSELITRLNGMLAKLSNGSEARPDGIDDLSDKLRSDEEIFDFIDNELGIS